MTAHTEVETNGASTPNGAPHANSNGRPPELRIWFEDLEKQEQASRIGMWLFLITELLLFGALFGLYVAYRVDHSAEFAEAARHNNLLIGTVNTFVLVTSSFLVAWSVFALRARSRGLAKGLLAITVLLGGVFLVFKGIEYNEHFHHGIYPGLHYAYAEMPGRGARLFFTLYYFMTGLHALHVIGGMTALAIIAFKIHSGSIRPEYPVVLDNGALYWHLVDAVWIVLWPLLYLMR